MSYRYQLNAKCQEFVTRYLGQSLITPEDPRMIQVNRRLLALAFKVGRVNLTPSPRTFNTQALSTDICFAAPLLDARLAGGGLCV